MKLGMISSSEGSLLTGVDGDGSDRGELLLGTGVVLGSARVLESVEVGDGGGSWVVVLGVASGTVEDVLEVRALA